MPSSGCGRRRFALSRRLVGRARRAESVPSEMRFKPPEIVEVLSPAEENEGRADLSFVSTRDVGRRGLLRGSKTIFDEPPTRLRPAAAGGGAGSVARASRRRWRASWIPAAPRLPASARASGGGAPAPGAD